MKKYNRFLEYPYNFNIDTTVVVSDFPDPAWCEKNLNKTIPKYSTCSATDTKIFIGYTTATQSSHINDDVKIVCYDSIDNYKMIIENFSHLIIEIDPFRPDLIEIPRVDTQLSRYDHLIKFIFG